MIRKRKPYKTYTKEFKLEALRLMEQSGDKHGALGVHDFCFFIFMCFFEIGLKDKAKALH